MIEYDEIDYIEMADDADTFDITNKAGDLYQAEGNFCIDDIIVHNCIPDAIANRDGKNQGWQQEMHPDLLKILGDTYGQIVWQEQLTAIWQRFAGFTGPESQEARKAIAKKWVSKLKPVKQKWLDGASKTMGLSQASAFWDKMETFGRYAFNKCLGKDTLVKDEATGTILTIQDWNKFNTWLPVLLSNCDGEVKPNQCIDIHDNGEQEVFLVEFDDGTTEQTTLNHQFKCEDGQYHTVKEIYERGLEVAKSLPTSIGYKTEV